MLNTAPSRSLARRTRQLLIIAFVTGSIGVFFIAIGFVAYLILLYAVGTFAAQVQRGVGAFLIGAGSLAVLAAFGFALRSITHRRENDLAMQTGQYLQNYLDERYRFIRNINRPSLGYIDAVLVGPPGILVFRILNSTGEFLNHGEDWVRKSNANDWMPWRVNPTKEALVDVRAVQTYLRNQKLDDPPVYGVVVFSVGAPQNRFQTKEPIVPVAHFETLIEALKDNYLLEERLNARMIDRVTKMLMGDV